MIYLVDDDTDDLELLKDAFERNGFRGQVACAINGEDFLSQLDRSNLPALVVLDLNMPLKDGFEVLTQLKKSRNFSALPVAILTASTNKQDEKKCVALGCNLFLKKPSTLQGYDAIVIMLLECLRNCQGNKACSTVTPEG
jgi:CheY-like chemotaxis protein